MPFCKGAERGCDITPPERVQTSLWSGITREPDKQTSGGDADLSAAATLAGAAPILGNKVCLPQVRIVKVSSGKERRSESARFDCPVVLLVCLGSLELPPRSIRE